MITLGIVDDNFEIRENLKRIFELFDDIELVFEGKDGSDAVAVMKTNQRKPDLFLMDVEMRDMNGIDATRAIKAIDSTRKILVLTVLEDESTIREAMLAGADGYLLKAEKPLKMVELIRNASEGRFPLSPKVAELTRKQLAQQQRPQKSPSDYSLTKREIEVLHKVVEGLSYNQIADHLIISPKTVQGHIERIYSKLGVHSKVEATRIVFENSWV